MNIGGDQETIISAGIDIGTSTTKIIISEFSVSNMAGATHVPRMEIVNKKILYKSPIYRTPLLSTTFIDMEKVTEIVKEEYEKAGITASSVATGAIIITGETATKKNAAETIHSLSQLAGDFLVATAGPDLEAIIAAKGSGAFQLSKETGRTVANIDIGGGTANIAVYRSGIFQGTCTLHVGGRLIEFEDERVKKLSKPIKKLIEQKQVDLREGTAKNNKAIVTVLNEMTTALASVLDKNISNEHPLLLGHVPDWNGEIDTIVFSGGVSECLYGLDAGAPTEYSDIGSMLARTLKESERLKKWEWSQPVETVRATVLGAGMQTTDISGSTIQVDPLMLPLRNLPIYKVFLQADFFREEKLLHVLEDSIKQTLHLYDPQQEGNRFALYVAGLFQLGFYDIQRMADALIESYEKFVNPDVPIIIVLENDYAKVLGQTLLMKQLSRPFLCIDQIHVEHGDYIDIGRILKSEVVPVVVKTLAFHT